MKDRIIEIIEELTEYDDLKSNINVDLFEENILDSLAFIELIEALEDEYNIEIQPTQINPDTWRNVDSICEMVENLK